MHGFVSFADLRLAALPFFGVRRFDAVCFDCFSAFSAKKAKEKNGVKAPPLQKKAKLRLAMNIASVARAFHDRST